MYGLYYSLSCWRNCLCVGADFNGKEGVLSRIFDQLLQVNREEMVQAGVENAVNLGGEGENEPLVQESQTNAQGTSDIQENTPVTQNTIASLKELVSSKNLPLEEQNLVFDFLNALEQMDEAGLVKAFSNSKVRSVFTDLVMEQLSIKPEEVSTLLHSPISSF